MLTVKPAVTMIGGIETDQHGIYLRDDLLCTYPCTEDGYRHARAVCSAANVAIERNLSKIKTDAARHADTIRLLNLAGRLGMNRYGLTNYKEVTL